MSAEDEIRVTDARSSDAIDTVRRGGRLSRRERRDLRDWLALRQTDYLAAIADRLSAPNEIPSEVSEQR